LVIGGQRCGTTYLHDRLAEHPQVAMARPARPEPKVFCSDEATDRGREWYVATWFADAGDALILGDKSTSYIECAGAPERAQRMLGNPLVLVQLRDPVARAISNWKFSRDHGMEQRPVEEALADCLDGREPAWDRARFSVSPYAYLERGRYAEHLRPWTRVFPEYVRVQFHEEMTGNAGAYAELFGWLGVDRDFRPAGIGETVNPSAGAPPTLEAGLVERLRGYFSASDEALATMLGRALPWRRGGRG
jgi:hypothetical protein